MDFRLSLSKKQAGNNNNFNKSVVLAYICVALLFTCSQVFALMVPHHALSHRSSSGSRMSSRLFYSTAQRITSFKRLQSKTTAWPVISNHVIKIKSLVQNKHNPTTTGIFSGSSSSNSFTHTLKLPMFPVECNGNQTYCNQRYSEMTFVGSYNSPFVGSLPQHNQYISIDEQLKMGIRLFHVQVHFWETTVFSSLNVCRSSCMLENAGSLRRFIRRTVRFLQDNPTEVLSVIFENIDNSPLMQWHQLFQEEGVEKLAFTPSHFPLAPNDWPTLGNMIEAGQRMVIFLDRGADHQRVPYILDEFENVFETAVKVTDPEFPNCKLSRPIELNSGENQDERSVTESRLFLMNHLLSTELKFLNKTFTIARRGDASKVNAEIGRAGIITNVFNCKQRWDRLPNMIMLNWVDVGPVMKIERDLNKEWAGLEQVSHKGNMTSSSSSSVVLQDKNLMKPIEGTRQRQISLWTLLGQDILNLPRRSKKNVDNHEKTEETHDDSRGGSSKADQNNEQVDQDQIEVHQGGGGEGKQTTTSRDEKKMTHGGDQNDFLDSVQLSLIGDFMRAAAMPTPSMATTTMTTITTTVTAPTVGNFDPEHDLENEGNIQANGGGLRGIQVVACSSDDVLSSSSSSSSSSDDDLREGVQNKDDASSSSAEAVNTHEKPNPNPNPNHDLIDGTTQLTTAVPQWEQPFWGTSSQSFNQISGFGTSDMIAGNPWYPRTPPLTPASTSLDEWRGDSGSLISPNEGISNNYKEVFDYNHPPTRPGSSSSRKSKKKKSKKLKNH